MSHVSASVKQVLDSFWDGHIPVRFRDILHGLKIKLHDSETLTDDRTSYVRKSEDGYWHVYISKNEPYLRKRFALAHVIGHIVLGHLTIIESHSDKVESYIVNCEENNDKLANQFAIELLFPENSIDLVIMKSLNYSDLCDKLEMSEVAVKQRIDKILRKNL